MTVKCLNCFLFDVSNTVVVVENSIAYEIARDKLEEGGTVEDAKLVVKEVMRGRETSNEIRD